MVVYCGIIQHQTNNKMKNLTINIFVQLNEETKYGTASFQHTVKKQEGNQVYLKGFRSPFTLDGDCLKRKNQTWKIEGQDGSYNTYGK